MIDKTKWRCGHDRTPENTKFAGQHFTCRTCQNKYQTAYRRRARAEITEAERYEDYRRRYIKIQLPATEHKLAMLRNEAERLGLTELLPPAFADVACNNPQLRVNS